MRERSSQEQSVRAMVNPLTCRASSGGRGSEWLGGAEEWAFRARRLPPTRHCYVVDYVLNGVQRRIRSRRSTVAPMALEGDCDGAATVAPTWHWVRGLWRCAGSDPGLLDASELGAADSLTPQLMALLPEALL